MIADVLLQQAARLILQHIGCNFTSHAQRIEGSDGPNGAVTALPFREADGERRSAEADAGRSAGEMQPEVLMGTNALARSDYGSVQAPARQQRHATDRNGLAYA